MREMVHIMSCRNSLMWISPFAGFFDCLMIAVIDSVPRTSTTLEGCVRTAPVDALRFGGLLWVPTKGRRKAAFLSGYLSNVRMRLPDFSPVGGE